MKKILLTQGQWTKGKRMKRIPLTQGQYALVDNCKYEWLNQYKWYAAYDKRRGTFYAARQTYDKKTKQQYTVKMHRELLGLSKGDGIYGHHQNHNGIDNRLMNLKVVTNLVNSWNKRNALGYTFAKDKGKYRSQIWANGKSKFLGYFNTEEEAHQAYLDAKALRNCECQI